MRKLLNFGRDIAGVAALEMALIAPLIAGMALVSSSVWQLASTKQDMRAAQVGSGYHERRQRRQGRQALVLSSWSVRRRTPPRACRAPAVWRHDHGDQLQHARLGPSARRPSIYPQRQRLRYHGWRRLHDSSSNVVRVR